MVITVLEHEKISISHRENIDKKIISKRDSELLRELEIKKGKNIFKWGRNTISFTQWIGVITLKNYSIEVLPKIADDIEYNKLLEILIYMINDVYNVKIQRNINSKLAKQKNGMIDILINLFLDELELQLTKGYYKEYKKNINNLNSIKGSIDFKSHINKNLISKNRFMCKYSKLTENNDLNKIIKSTLKYLMQLNITVGTKSKLRVFYDMFWNIEDVNEPLNLINKICFNRQNERFSEIINYCKLFLNNIGTNINTGNYVANSFLIDMNDLFEKFIYTSYRKINRANTIYQSNNYYLLKGVSNNKNKIQLRPDIIIKDEYNRLNVIDTKWKIIDCFASQQDIYQMNAYITGINNVKDAILLFPKYKNNDKIVGDFFINGKINKIKIRTIDMRKIGTTDFYKDLSEIIK